jgi:hypothetical protein
MDVTAGSRAKLGCLVGYMFMYLTGHPNLAQDPLVMPHHVSAFS